jgi:N-acetylglutamate synthase-like GNAT family acetyltransferase
MLYQFIEQEKLILDILIIMEINSKIVIRPIEPLDREWIIDLISERWRSTLIVTRGVKHETESLPGFIVYLSRDRVGLLTYSITNAECEIITLDSLMENIGIGSMLLLTSREIAIKSSCNRLWLITTNDNISGLRFFQKRGFQLVAVHKNALEISRRLKPEIPMIGLDGIPLRDEIELEMRINH